MQRRAEGRIGEHNWASEIFFFKQKTAYEMRDSDWSSDVCSSDLFEIACFTSIKAVFFLHFDQIGRASCRERVCQYV